MIEENSVADLALKSPIFAIGAIILFIGLFTKIKLLSYSGVILAILGTLRLKK